MPLDAPVAPRHRSDIQGLRAVAVILVILCHANVRGFRGGFLGVDVFFVISGFVITKLLHRAPPRQVLRNLGSFYVRRVRRIVPAATVVLCATVLVAWWVLGPALDPALFTDVRWASLFAGNYRMAATGIDYFVAGVFPSLVTHFWSLGVEEQFYAVFPLAVFSLTWLTPRRGRAALLGVVTLLAVVASAWWSWHLTPHHHVDAYYLPFTRFWELGLGSLTALVPTTWAGVNTKWRSVVSVGAAAALAAAVAFVTNGAQVPGVITWWPCGATALLLWTGDGSSGVVVRVLRWRPLALLGDVSYSLYLWHYLWVMLPLQMANPPQGWWVTPAEILGALACAIASYVLIENPIRRSTRLDRDPWSVVLVLAICVALTWNVAWMVSRAAHLA